ncbi:MAG TPA: Smr/MutS family protein [Methylomirabilota bacterium]|nr:Smr/MutS family protein [Methylomirabilota bacterium]
MPHTLRPADDRGRRAATGIGPGRLAALPGGAAESVLEPGALRGTLVIAGHPLGELRPGTRLRLGDGVLVELDDGPAEGGLREEDGAPPVPARVVQGGVVRVDDPVVIEAVRVPIEDALDLHSFRADEIAEVVGEYLRQAHAAGFRTVRLIHGRGRGVQRETVRRTLARSPLVARFGDAPPELGGWGATLAELRDLPEWPEPPAP